MSNDRLAQNLERAAARAARAAGACFVKPTKRVDTNIIDTIGAWKPMRTDRRVAIMMHPPSPNTDLAILRAAATEVQAGLHQNLESGQNLWTRMFWFRDGQCDHSSDWSRTMIDATNAAEQHCYQGESRYAQAFESLAHDSQRLIARDPFDRIDGVIMIGNRFDEQLGNLLPHVKTLTDRGSKLFALQIPPHSDEVDRVFRDMIGDHGAAVQVARLPEVQAFIPELTKAILTNDTRGLLRLGYAGKKLALTFRG